MTPELAKAILDRITLGYSEEQIASELRTAGYDEVTIKQSYVAVCARMTTNVLPLPAPPTKKGVRLLVIFSFPFVAFIGLLLLWRLINLLAEDSQSSTAVVFLNEQLIPFLVGLTFLSIPIFVIWAIVAAVRR